MMKLSGILNHRCWRLTPMLVLLCLASNLHAQLNQNYFKVKDNAMFIGLMKKSTVGSLDTFTAKYNLRFLGLHQLLITGKDDSLKNLGWNTDFTDALMYHISKPLDTAVNFHNPDKRIIYSAVPTPDNWRIIGGNRISYGLNKFRGGTTFERKGDITYFRLKGHSSARTVKLAGNFTNWQYGAFKMEKTDGGWIAAVKLAPGQYYYKFIINEGMWITDPDNELKENDGRGNINSYFFITNKKFVLDRYPNAREVYLSGSFNNWNKRNIPLIRTTTGWYVDMFLAEGTHEYEFIVDGVSVKPGSNNSESTTSIGKAYWFALKGFQNAREVFLAGDFNDWKPRQLPMRKTATGWEIPYVLGAGNYQYKFIVDGRWITDPENKSIVDDGKGNSNSFLVVGPNHTFSLPAFKNAKKVFLVGDFNNWSENSLPMKKTADGWAFDIYLAKGKHVYKFIVDGKWLLDPSNKNWEENEFDSGNSVIWIEKP